MRKQLLYSAVVLGAVTVIGSQAGRLATVYAAAVEPATAAVSVPVVFQAAGPTVQSIQSMVDAYRAALGGVNNGNVPGPIDNGRREINWDGGGSTATSPAPTPFDGFLLTRGTRFVTPGSGFIQAPLDGLVSTFENPTYATIFQPFSPVRLFTPVRSRVTHVRFFLPGGGELPATTSGFGAVFSDVDESGSRGAHDDRGEKRRHAATAMVFYGVDGKVLYSVDVPASKGDASLSFLGVLFDRARVAAVRITAGTVAPGPNESASRDVVMMDDFIYGEPQLVVPGYPVSAELDDAASDAR